MAKCVSCGATIVFGGKRKGDLLFCSDKCATTSSLLTALDQVPKDLLERQIISIHQGRCPKCKGDGPVDVHTSHRVWSALIMTSSVIRPQICCGRCGIKSKIGDGMISLVVGWWGFPWGIIMTPVQVSRNVIGIFSKPDPATPSAALRAMIELDIARKVLAAQAQASNQTAQ